jgi:hypothetical protein
MFDDGPCLPIMGCCSFFCYFVCHIVMIVIMSSATLLTDNLSSAHVDGLRLDWEFPFINDIY